MKIRETLARGRCKETLAFLDALHEKYKNQCEIKNSAAVTQNPEKKCAQMRGLMGLIREEALECTESVKLKP